MLLQDRGDRRPVAVRRRRPRRPRPGPARRSWRRWCRRLRARSSPPAPRRAWRRTRPRSGRRRCGRRRAAVRWTKPGDAGAEALVVGGDAGGGERAHGDAVVAHLAGDDLDLLRLALEPPVVAGDLERGLVRLGAAGGEVEVVEGAGEELGQLGGQLDRRAVRRDRRRSGRRRPRRSARRRPRPARGGRGRR